MLSFFSKLKSGLTKSSTGLTQNIKLLFTGKKLDTAACEALEEALIQADMGVETATKLVEKIRKQRFDQEVSEADIRALLAEEIAEILTPCQQPTLIVPQRETHEGKPWVVLMVGVNGSGKTTTIGKLAALWAAEGKKVTLAAGDTFRAGAVAQLNVWAKRAGVEVISADKDGADPSAVMYKAHASALQNGSDIIIADTAGRLQNRAELMEELAKITRTLKKQDDTSPHAVWLVLDATVGQNAFSQVEAFAKTAGVTGLIITKLDGSAKGGVVVGLADKFKLPILWIGIGETLDDLRPFHATDFAKALMGVGE